MSDKKSVLLVCDRKEGDVAVLLSDEGEEIKVLSSLSLSLSEGGVYRCVLERGKVVLAERDEEEEARRREASASLLSRLFGKK